MGVFLVLVTARDPIYGDLNVIVLRATCAAGIKQKSVFFNETFITLKMQRMLLKGRREGSYFTIG